jgi:flavin reductase (DIM6/NTAB) family NADH-FMN oxidoreductase RutF
MSPWTNKLNLNVHIKTDIMSWFANDKTDFVNVKVLDNFYQTSSFYPMPVVLCTTVSQSGLTNIGSYSLCFPFGISKDHYMMLISRGTSNTANNIRNNKTVALNFIPYDKTYLKNAVELGYPGETTEEKLKESIFTLIPSSRADSEQKSGLVYPEIIKESVQVFECTVDESGKFKYDGPEIEAHFLLKIDKIIMQERYADYLKAGEGFPTLPVDFGYRDSKQFWFSKHSHPYAEPIPKAKGVDVNSVRYQVERMDSDIKWHPDAYKKLVKVPRIFMKMVISKIIDAAIEEGIDEVTPDFLDKVNAKRR